MKWFARIPLPAGGPIRAALVLAALATLTAVASEGAGPYSLTLKGKSFDERCLKLAAGESIRYGFRSTAPVDFNIHFHRGAEVVYPVQQAAVREAEASFVAPAADDYCLMWEHAGAGSATVEGTLERVPAR
jgi:hypothetical protein